MAFNGSGVFVRLYNWVNDAAAAIKIRADRMDAEMDGMATGLSTCITKDGQTTVTANLPMATYRHTGVGNASARTDYAAAGQVQDGKLNWADAGGTADAFTVTYTPTVTALVDGQLCYVRAKAANATTTPTFRVDSTTARTIVKNGGTALVAGDIAADGHELILRYDLSNTRWELMNPAVTGVVTTSGNQTISGNKTFSGTTTLTGDVAVSGTSSAAAGIVLAEDTDNGVNTVTVRAPAAVTSNVTATLQDAAGTIAYTSDIPTIYKQIVQRVRGTTAAAATGSTQMVNDDSIPQSGEGFEVLTQAVTPTNASNILYIFGTVCFGSAAAESVILALFQDSTADALAAWGHQISITGTNDKIVFSFFMVAGTTSATTFKLRLGPVSAATTLTINGTGGARKLGGVQVTDLNIWEIQV